jgi:hypothetical protein
MEEEDQQQQQPQPKKNQAMINISFTLPNNLYKAAWAICNVSGYDSFEDYLCNLVRQDVEMEIEGNGQLHGANLVRLGQLMAT